MSLRYRITRRKNTIGNQKKTQYIMQAVSRGVVTIDDICEEISRECSLTSIDVKFALHAMADKLQQHLEEGKIVDLDNLGKFKIGFKCKAESNPEDLSVKKSIKKFHLNFQPSTKIKKWLKLGFKVYKEGSRSYR